MWMTVFPIENVGADLVSARSASYASGLNSRQYKVSGHSPQLGFLAVQQSRPKSTIRWQKSLLSSGGRMARSCFSTFSGSLPVLRPRRPQMRMQWVSQTTLPGTA